MLIQVLGPGCVKCNEAETLVRNIAAELNNPATIEKVTDFKEMMRLGVMSTPAVVIDGEVKYTGRVPTADKVRAWVSA